MPKIFISYRRTDSAYASKGLYDHCVDQYGVDSVVFDVDSIPLGADFVEYLNEHVSQCDALLAIIGDSWLDAESEDGTRRLDDPDDFVRIEIESALRLGIAVIPVLIGEAKMPRKDDLPESLKPLSTRQAAEFRSGRYSRSHLEQLVRGLDRIFEDSKQSSPPKGKASPPQQRTDHPAETRKSDKGSKADAGVRQKLKSKQGDVVPKRSIASKQSVRQQAAERPECIFIIHSTKDREFVEREIVSLLKGHGIDVWYSPQDIIQAATEWEKSVLEGLKRCDWFLVVLSPRSVESRWVQSEVHWAIDKMPDRIVPVLMEDCDWGRLHLMMRTLQHVDLSQDLIDGKRRLLQTWSMQSTQPESSVSDVVTNSIGMQLKLIPAGEFMMGSPARDKDAPHNEKPQHRVRITKPFYLGVYQVTQQQFETVMGVRPWQGEQNVQEGPDYPAVYVDDAVEFCRKLSEQEGVEYRLPTEAQWEYACRAGTTTEYSFGDDASQLGQYAWYDKNAWDMDEKYAHPVGQKLPNPWGIYDMHGNVYEWCWDWLGEYFDAVADDPSGPASGECRVLRGGSFSLLPPDVRSACRGSHQPTLRSRRIGMRAARTFN